MSSERRPAAPADNGNRCALLRWQGREGNWLVATAASRSRAGVTYTVRVHLVTRAVTCTCPTTRGYCWHRAAALEGAWRYLDTLEVQRTMPSDFLASQVEQLAPSNLGGVMALAWLAAKRVLWERQSTAQAA